MAKVAGEGAWITVWSEVDGKETPAPYQLRSLAYSMDSLGVALVTLNQPKNLNPLRLNMFWEMHVLLEHMARDDKVRVAVWTGAGRAFCSGADFMEPSPATSVPPPVQEYMHKQGKGRVLTDIAVKGLVLNFVDFPKPSICAINGLAIGGGANLAFMCHDLVYASAEAQFRYPFTSLGIVPELSSSLVVAQACGSVKAKELLLLGDWFDAERAERCNLVNEVLPAAQLLPRALRVAQQLARTNPTALRMSKRLMAGHTRAAVEAALDAENEAIAAAMQTEDFQKGMMEYAKSRSKSAKGKAAAKL